MYGIGVESKVCSYEQAEKLKALGVCQKSLYSYVDGWLNPRREQLDNGQYIIHNSEKHITQFKAQQRGAKIEFVSAFDVSELGVMLPNEVYGANEIFTPEIWTYCELDLVSDFRIQYRSNKNSLRVITPIIHERTEAKARAEIILNLINNSYLHIEALNRRYEFYFKLKD